ncbi:hypothetical protein PINS_up016090 [Pythium insidiosum]|nr:hypothetical protein PINS_up016090 [Pythium insidiosum]
MAPSSPKASRQRRILNLKPGDPVLLVKKPRNRRKHPSFARREFDLIRQLDDNASLDRRSSGLATEWSYVKPGSSGVEEGVDFFVREGVSGSQRD